MTPSRSLPPAVRRFLLAMTFSLLGYAAINWFIEREEQQGNLSTYRGRDDMVQFLDQDMFALTPDGGSYVTTPYAEQSMLHQSFVVNKGNGWRVFIEGESFAMGTPYVHQPDRNKPGSIASFLQADLDALAPSRRIEIINSAAGGQDSHRVRKIAERELDLSPDLLLVATCNNEGELAPWRLTETLRKFGGVRLLTKLLVPSPKAAERSYYTLQDPDTVRVRSEFRENVDAILRQAQERNVKVLLCTLPVNLRYSGLAGHFLNANPDGAKNPASHPAPCVSEAQSLIAKGESAQAESALGACDDVEAVRVLGLLQYDQGRYGEAHQTLERYTELRPNNRCRPSFNQIIRDEAAAYPGTVRLVDLQKRAETESPHGLGGDELFIDYCHMNWSGYAAMEDEILLTLQRENWLPGNNGKRPSREELRERFHLPAQVEQPVTIRP